MTYLAAPSVQIDAWVNIGSDTEICYEIIPVDDDVEFTIGGRNGLKLTMSEAALRSCVETFTDALDALIAGHPAQPELTSCDGVAPASAG